MRDKSSSQETTSMIFQGSGRVWKKWRGPLPIMSESQTLVRILACTICGSDLHSIHGRRSVPTPSILGHEIVGEIEFLGCKGPSRSIDGTQLKIGDRICWSLVTNCDECYYCKQGLPQKCSAAVKYGHHLWNSPDDLTGGFSEHCILQPGTKIMRLPRDMPLEIACPISCATSTISAAIEAACIQTNDIVMVVGAGLLGLTASAMAKYAGAAQVICLEPNPVRRELSMQFGVNQAVDAANLDRVSQQLTSGRGVDCVIECSGSNNSFSAALALTRMGGRIVLVGSVFPGCTVHLDLDQIVRRNLNLIGIHNYAPHHLQRAVAFASSVSDVYPFQKLVSDWYSLEDMQDAIDKAGNGQSIRVGIKMQQVEAEASHEKNHVVKITKEI